MHEHVFISYDRRDERVADQISQALAERGYNCWWDRDIPGGVEWERRIAEQIQRLPVFLVIASDRAAESKWVRWEIKEASKADKPIIPVALSGEIPDDLPPALGPIQFVTWPEGVVTEETVQQLISALIEAGLGMVHKSIDAELDWSYLEKHFDDLTRNDRERLDHIADIVRTSFETTPGSPIWTIHGLRHANRLLYALSEILEERQRADRHEVFCAVAAACLHDLGLVLYTRRDSEDGNEEEAGEADTQQAQRSLERTRRRVHADLSAEWLQNNAGRLRLTGQETRTVGELVRYHNPTTNIQMLGDEPGLARLASAFRLANVCDAGPERAPLDIWNRQQQRIRRDCQGGFWLLNLMTSAITVHRDEEAIAVCARSPSEDLFFVPEQLSQEIQRRQSPLTPFIGRWEVKPERLLDPTLNLNIRREDMAINGMRFLSDPYATLTSSSDLVDYFVACLKSITAPDYDESTPEDKLECLNQVVNELVQSRPELHALHDLKKRVAEAQKGRGIPDEDKLTAISHSIEQLGRKPRFFPARPRPRNADRTIFDSIADNALGVLRRPDTSLPLRFFVFGKSGPVTYFLHSCAANVQQVEVFTPVMRPVGEGSLLQVPKALEDIEGLTCHVVPDAAIPLVLHSRLAAANPRPYQASSDERVGPNVALLGCEAVFPGHEDPEVADIGTSLGALAVAQMAEQAGIPLLVLTDKAKFVADVERSPWWPPSADSRIQELPAVAFMHEPDAARWAEQSAQSHPESDTGPADNPEESPGGYPRSETVPGKYIRYIVTEEKPLTPAEAADELRSMQE